LQTLSTTSFIPVFRRWLVVGCMDITPRVLLDQLHLFSIFKTCNIHRYTG